MSDILNLYVKFILFPKAQNILLLTMGCVSFTRNYQLKGVSFIAYLAESAYAIASCLLCVCVKPCHVLQTTVFVQQLEIWQTCIYVTFMITSDI